MKKSPEPIRLIHLMQEDLDFLANYEWKRTKQKELMSLMLSMFRSYPEVPKSIFTNAWRTAQTFAFKDDALSKVNVSEDLEGSSNQGL